MTGHRIYEDWLKSGRSTPFEGELKHHVEHCALCADDFKALTVAEDLFALPGLDGQTADRIRDRLQAESQKLGERPPLVLGSRGRWLWIPALAAAALIALILLLPTLHRHPAPVSSGPEFTITADAGALWKTLSRGTSTVISVERGAIGFAVRSLSRGESFHVVAGDDWIEVRGTRFRVTVGPAGLEEVRVSEGVVALHTRGIHRLLLAGMNWKRKAASVPVVEPAPPVMVTTLPPTGPVPAAMKGSPAVAAPRTPRTIPGTSVAPAAMKPAPASSLKHPGETTGPAARFAAAYRTLQSGNWREALGMLQLLLARPGLGALRADVLFWTAQAHLRGGQYGLARARLEQFLRAYPHSHRATDARKQLALLKKMK